MTRQQQIKEAVNGQIDFGNPVSVTPHYRPIGITAIENDNDKIYLRMHDGYWFELKETDQNYDLIADAIINKLNGSNELQS